MAKRIRLDVCKDRCKRHDFPVKILHSRFTNKWFKTYTSKEKKEGKAKCRVCGYITAEPHKLGDRCLCCSRMLSRAIYHKDKVKSPDYIEPARIE